VIFFLARDQRASREALTLRRLFYLALAGDFIPRFVDYVPKRQLSVFQEMDGGFADYEAFSCA
jgi:hypothetical protein